MRQNATGRGTPILNAVLDTLGKVSQPMVTTPLTGKNRAYYSVHYTNPTQDFDAGKKYVIYSGHPGMPPVGVFDTMEEAQDALPRWNGPPFQMVGEYALLRTPQDAADWHATKCADRYTLPGRLPCLVKEWPTWNEEAEYQYLYPEDIAEMAKVFFGMSPEDLADPVNASRAILTDGTGGANGEG